MLRFLVVLALGLSLTVAGLLLPWGLKEVTTGACETEFHPATVTTVERCDWHQTNARYWSDHITLDTLDWQTIDNESGDARVGREFRDYKPTGERLDGNPALFWGRPIAWFAIGVAGIAMGSALVAKRGKPIHQYTTAWGVLGAAALLSLALVLSLGGMLIHAATWAGRTVEPWRPESGSILLFVGGTTALWSAIKFYQYENARLSGHTTPLAPILVLDIPDEEAASGLKLNRDWLAWPIGRYASIVAVLLMLLVIATPLPIAAKDIMVRNCTDESGTSCTLTGYRVEYQTFGAHVDAQPGGPATTHFMAYQTEFQQFDTPNQVQVVPYMAGLAVAATAWFGWRQNRAPSIRGARSAALAATAGLALWIAPIVHHSMNWAGVPAGPLRPGFAILLLVLAGLSLWIGLFFQWWTTSKTKQS